jgi:hypothetical protein
MTGVATKLEIVLSSIVGRAVSLKELRAYPGWLRAQLAAYESEAPRLRREFKLAAQSIEQQSLAVLLTSLCERTASSLASGHPDPIALPAQRLLRMGLARAAGRLPPTQRRGGTRRAASMDGGTPRRVSLADALISRALRQVVAK